MEIRELKASDLHKLSSIAESVTEDLASKIGEEVDDKKAGIQIFMSVIKLIPNEIREFFAHVTDQSVEEYDEKPFTYPLKVAKALFDKEEIKDFFSEVKDLITKVTTKE